MRACEACNGPGPCLWAGSGPNGGRYCCVKCHPEPRDRFFVEQVPALEPPQPERPGWLILCTDEPGHGGVGLWWKPGGKGYTRDLDKAGRWTEAEARATAGGRDSDMAVRLADVEPKSHRVVDLDHIDGARVAIHARRRADHDGPACEWLG